jgi:hypothetical protein
MLHVTHIFLPGMNNLTLAADRQCKHEGDRSGAQAGIGAAAVFGRSERAKGGV